MTYQYRREPLTDDEQAKMFNACRGLRDTFVYVVLLDTGLRVSEFCNLNKESIEWQHDRVTVFGKGGIYGKQSRRRVVPLSQRAKRLLETHFTAPNPEPFTPRTIQRLIKGLAARAGLTKRVTPHVLRHTFAINSVRRGISSRALQSVMGHDHLTTTEIYLNMSPEAALEEYRRKF